MAIEWNLLALPKPRPRVLDRIAYKRQREVEERACRLKVDARDQHRCFFPGCRRRASEKHHIVPSSVRGKRLWRSDDILSSCHDHHAWFKAGLIQVRGNPDRGPVKVYLTMLGLEAGIRIPSRAA